MFRHQRIFLVICFCIYLCYQFELVGAVLERNWTRGEENDCTGIIDRNMRIMRRKYDIIQETCPATTDLNLQALQRFQNFPYPLIYECGQRKLAKFAVVLKSPPVSTNRPDAPQNVSVSEASAANQCRTAFNPVRFLSMLRGKVFGIYGDSLCRQIFNALIAATLEHTPVFIRNTSIYTNHYFPEFQVNITFCQDGLGLQAIRNVKESEYPYCLKALLPEVDYLMLGFAAWFKPFFTIKPYEEPDYMKNFYASAGLLSRSMDSVRKFITSQFQYPAERLAAKTSPPKLIWRLAPHSGFIDEVSHFAPHEKTLLEHGNGVLWSTNMTSNQAIWINRYNAIIRDIAYANNDAILDWYSFSMFYAEKIHSFGLNPEVHVDSLHYCLEGMPLGTNLLIEHALRSVIHRSSSSPQQQQQNQQEQLDEQEREAPAGSRSTLVVAKKRRIRKSCLLKNEEDGRPKFSIRK